jgi:hypothetical protein
MSRSKVEQVSQCAMATVPYEKDFTAWASEQAQLLRDRQFEQIDWTNLIEEVDGLGRSERQAIASYLTVLLTHLLKWQYQPSGRQYTDVGIPCGSWIGAITNSRRRIDRLIQHNPSLKFYPQQCLTEAYDDAVEVAQKETGMNGFPMECPFSIEDVMQSDWLPEF